MKALQLKARPLEVRLDFKRLFEILISTANIAQRLARDGAIVIGDFRLLRAERDAARYVAQCLLIAAQRNQRGAAIDIGLAHFGVQLHARFIVGHRTLQIVAARFEDAAIDIGCRPVGRGHGRAFQRRGAGLDSLFRIAAEFRNLETAGRQAVAENGHGCVCIVGADGKRHESHNGSRKHMKFHIVLLARSVRIVASTGSCVHCKFRMPTHDFSWNSA